MICCATGHRPTGFPFAYHSGCEREQRYRALLSDVIRMLIDGGYTHFISGMAVGADLDFAEAVLDAKAYALSAGRMVTLEAAVPCPDQTSKWSAWEKKRYDEILKRCDTRMLISPVYTSGCMQKRNMYMVDKSDLVLAIWNGAEHGGTWNTIAYTRRVGKPLCFLMLNEI